MAVWQVQEAKQRFSEVIRRAGDEGPQVVTRHGEEIAVVIDIDEYRRLRGQEIDFAEFLLSGPKVDEVDELEIVRSGEPTRTIDFLEGE